MKKSYLIVGGLSVCLVGYIGYGYLFASNPSNDLSFQGVESGPVEVIEKDFQISINSQGTTKITNEQKLRFNTAGRVVAVNFKVGDEVLLGQTIVEIDDKEAQNEIEKASLTLSNSKIKLNDFTRDVEDSGLKKALLEMDSITSELKKQQINLEYIKNNNLKRKKQLELDLLAEVNNYKILEQESKKNISHFNLSDADKEKILQEKRIEITKAESEYNKAKQNLSIEIEQKQNEYKNKLEQEYLALQSSITDRENDIREMDKILGIGVDRDEFKYQDYFSAKYRGYKSDAKVSLAELKSQLDVLKNKISLISDKNDATNIILALEANKKLSEIGYKTANLFVKALENSVVTAGFSQGVIDGYSSTYSGQRSTMQSYISSVISTIDELKNYDSLEKIKQDLEDELDTKKNTLESLKIDLDKTIKSQDFLVDTVEFNIAGEEIKLSKAKTALEQKVLEIEKTNKTRDEELVEAQTTVAKTQISLEEAKKRYDKLSNLSANQEYSFLRNEVKQNQVSLQNAYKRLENYTIQAPFNGKVTKVDMKLGDRLNADTEKYISIVNPDDVQVHTYLNQSDIVKVRADMPVEMTIGAYEGVTFSGSISEIDSSPTDTNGISKYKVQISLNNPDSYTLYSGMNVAVKIIQEVLPSKLLVPYTAVTTDPDTGKSSVTVIDSEGGESSREVELGNTDGENYEVISGLQPGDKVAEIEYNPEKFSKGDFFDEEFE